MKLAFFQKLHISASRRRVRRGSTLVELSIVMALLAIVSVMIVSFSALVSNYLSENRARYAFLEQASEWKQTLSGWISEVDTEGATFLVDEQSITCGNAVAQFDETVKGLVFANADTSEHYVQEQIGWAKFELSPDYSVLKCTVGRSETTEEGFTQVFLLSLRCGAFAPSEEGGV